LVVHEMKTASNTRGAFEAGKVRFANLRDLLRLGLERGFGLLEDGLEGGFVGQCEISKNLSIEPDAGGLHAFHKTAVCQSVRTGRGVNALLPQHPEVALAGLTIPVSPRFRLHYRVLGVAEKFGAAPAEAFGFLEDFLAASPARGRIGGAWHETLMWFLSARCFCCETIRCLAR